MNVLSLAKVLVTVALGVLVAILLVFGVFRVFGWDNPFDPRDIDRSNPPILVSIQDLSQYHAAVGNFEVVIDDEKDIPWIPGVLAGERSLFIASGTVNAYVDFADLSENDIVMSPDGASVEIRLPEAELDRPNLAHDRTRLFSQDRGIVNRYIDALTTQDQSDLYEQATQKLQDAAEASELASQAETNTRAMLTGMFAASGLKVTFADNSSGE